jgi:predicted DNA-binding protein (MmcQ/YjbR family)
MDIEFYRDYCLSKAGVTEEFPFDNNTLVFKVMGKIFALTNVDLFSSVNLKCDPERAAVLREQYIGIIPGFHMNKKHWNTIQIDGSVSDKLFLDLVDHSYQLIVEGLSKKLIKELSLL